MRKADEFRALREMDAIAHLKPGVRYPAVLLTAGINDSRVEAWQAAKMAAVMQEMAAPDRPVLLRVAFDAGHGMGLTNNSGRRKRPTSTASSCGSSVGGPSRRHRRKADRRTASARRA